MKKLIVILGLILGFSAAAAAQPRPVEKPGQGKAAAARPAPESFEVKYQGGMFGYLKKEEGTLKFDDINERLVFYGKDQKEKFSIFYNSMLMIYPSEKSVQSGTGRAIGAIPLPGAGLGGSLLKKKKHYLVIQYADPDVDVRGTTSFLLDTDDLLDSVLVTIAEKAQLKKRGDVYIRQKSTVKVED